MKAILVEIKYKYNHTFKEKKSNASNAGSIVLFLYSKYNYQNSALPTCKSACGFQSCSKKKHVVAADRFKPKLPTRVVKSRPATCASLQKRCAMPTRWAAGTWTQNRWHTPRASKRTRLCMNSKHMNCTCTASASKVTSVVKPLWKEVTPRNYIMTGACVLKTRDEDVVIDFELNYTYPQALRKLQSHLPIDAQQGCRRKESLKDAFFCEV